MKQEDGTVNCVTIWTTEFVPAEMMSPRPTCCRTCLVEYCEDKCAGYIDRRRLAHYVMTRPDCRLIPAGVVWTVNGTKFTREYGNTITGAFNQGTPSQLSWGKEVILSNTTPIFPVNNNPGASTARSSSQPTPGPGLHLNTHHTFTNSTGATPLQIDVEHGNPENRRIDGSWFCGICNFRWPDHPRWICTMERMARCGCGTITNCTNRTPHCPVCGPHNAVLVKRIFTRIAVTRTICVRTAVTTIAPRTHIITLLAVQRDLDTQHNHDLQDQVRRPHVREPEAQWKPQNSKKPQRSCN